MKYPAATSNPNVTPSSGKGGSAGSPRAKMDKGRGMAPGAGSGGSAGTHPLNADKLKHTPPMRAGGVVMILRVPVSTPGMASPPPPVNPPGATAAPSGPAAGGGGPSVGP